MLARHFREPVGDGSSEGTDPRTSCHAQGENEQWVERFEPCLSWGKEVTYLQVSFCNSDNFRSLVQNSIIRRLRHAGFIIVVFRQVQRASSFRLRSFIEGTYGTAHHKGCQELALKFRN